MRRRKYRLTQQGHRRQVTQKGEPFRWLKHPISQLVTFLIAMGCAIYGSLIWFKPARFPVKEVEVVGELHHLERQDLYDVVMSESRYGFFGLNVSRLHYKMISMPWIHEAAVRRVWPGKLVVVLTEEKPIAKWNNDALLNESGEIFRPAHNTFPSDLPKLLGPVGKQAQVLQEFFKMDKILSPLALTISKMELAPRGAWYLSLNNGIDVILGTEEVEDRLRRFVHGYDKVLSEKAANIDYVDLRYTSGMAVGWKTG